MPIDVEEVVERFTVIRETPDRIVVREPAVGNTIIIREATARGPAGPQGIQGPPGIHGDEYVPFWRHVQGLPSAVWEINHNLGYYPGGIVVRDSSGGLHEGQVEYLDINNITISFFVAGLPASFSGEADVS